MCFVNFKLKNELHPPISPRVVRLTGADSSEIEGVPVLHFKLTWFGVWSIDEHIEVSYSSLSEMGVVMLSNAELRQL